MLWPSPGVWIGTIGRTYRPPGAKELPPWTTAGLVDPRDPNGLGSLGNPLPEEDVLAIVFGGNPVFLVWLWSNVGCTRPEVTC